ncbi:hypothetical protein J3F84DRAFT_359437 [Trichoderma pleuroticola]
MCLCLCLCLSWPTSGLLTPMATVCTWQPGSGLVSLRGTDSAIPAMSVWSEAVNTRTSMLVLLRTYHPLILATKVLYYVIYFQEQTQL